jgi:hypothetical protein
MFAAPIAVNTPYKLRGSLEPTFSDAPHLPLARALLQTGE